MYLQLHVKEDALVNFKSELAVMELEIQVYIFGELLFFNLSYTTLATRVACGVCTSYLNLNVPSR